MSQRSNTLNSGRSMHRFLVRVLLAGTLGLIAAADATAQTVTAADNIKIKLSGRLQVQWNTTSVDSSGGEPEPFSEYLLRRARLTFDVTFNDLLSARMEPDYSSIGGLGLFSLRDAYIRFNFGPGVRATLGQFKRPFDLFELTSSTQILVAERGGRVRGVKACGTILTVCSYSNISAGLLYSDRDLGLMLDGEAIPQRLRYAVSVTNGQTLRVQEANSGKQVTGRLSLTPVTGVTVSANGSLKDYLHPLTKDARHGMAWGGDVEVGNFTRGLHVQAGFIGGDNWRTARLAPEDTTDVVPFMTGQAIATYKRELDGKWIKGIEPLVRASWADPNRNLAADEGWLFTPGVILHFGTRNLLHLNVDVWVPDEGDTEYAFLTQMNFYF